MTEPIWSTGGVGGERAVTEDLEWAVRVLRSAASDVGSAQLELARRRAALELNPGVGQAAVLAELGHAALTLAPALEAQLDDTARRLAAVSAAYVDAERGARRRVGFLDGLEERASDAAGGIAWLARFGAAAAIVAGPVGGLVMATGHGDVVGDVLPSGGPPTTALVDRDTSELISLSPRVVEFEAALTFAMWMIEHLVAEPWDGGLTASRVSARPVRSLEGVMGQLFDTEQQGDGAVRIERWTGADGVTRRIVFIPGTTDWTPWRHDPSDLEADGELRFGALPDAARVVMAALEADGARPGEPVMLTGHSLGGTVAAALAANPDVRKRFTVRAIVTAGSPTGRIALPPRVYALQLEGTRDIVPGLDGKPNPDTPTRVTVHHDARNSQAPELDGAGKDVGSAHSLRTYAQTARLVDEGLGPSTDAWLNAERDFLEPGADAVMTEYRP